jgi:GMP synthase (glutamine-hydrolysing)
LSLLPGVFLYHDHIRLEPEDNLRCFDLPAVSALLIGKLPLPHHLRFLVAESEPQQAREARRESVGRSSGETYIDTLRFLAPGAVCHRVKPADRGAALPDRAGLMSYDAIFVTGSPLHLYQDTPETRREVDLMRAVFEAGVPSFGSCAGLQVATVAAGGAVRPSRRGREAGFARHITLTEAGHRHPLLAGRPASFDAPAFHSDEVETLPEGGTLLAFNTVTEVQAVEIRSGPGVFWGVQYHPELDLYEVAGALRRQCDELVSDGYASSSEALETYASMVEALHRVPNRKDLAWLLGLDEQVTEVACRLTELRNFIRFATEGQ